MYAIYIVFYLKNVKTLSHDLIALHIKLKKWHPAIISEKKISFNPGLCEYDVYI